MATTTADLDGLFKEAYGDDVINLVPDSVKLVKDIKFVEADKEEGNFYNQPVILSNEHGITFAGPDAGAFTLNAAIALTMKNAQVEGSQILLRSALSYDAAAKASNSRKAFVRATELLVENMLESASKYLESSILYGGSATGIGQCVSSVNTDATHTVATMTTEFFASGIWSGSEGAKLDAYHTSFGTKITANAALVVDSVDLDARTLTLSGNSTDIAAFDTQAAAGEVELVWFGVGTPSSSNQMAGIDQIITNTGTLFGISAATFTLWKGNVFAVGGALTFGKVVSGLANAVARGLNEKVNLYVNPITWGNLNDDLAGVRRYDSSYKPGKGELGNESIMYYSNTGGTIEVISHNMIKEGEAFALPIAKMRRLGAQDISFKTPGGREGEMFRQLTDAAGFELRNYTDQAVFLETPARAVKYTGIVNT